MSQLFSGEGCPGRRAHEANSLQTRRESVSQVSAASPTDVFTQVVSGPVWGWS